MLDDHRPDVLISDIAMPDEDGYTLIRRIRKRTSKLGGDIPALALTAYATGEDSKKAFAAGFHSHMAKPFETNNLGFEVARLGRPPKK
jgi:CheY-like chemotaxis protein